jgi:hypothetical protein
MGEYYGEWQGGPLTGRAKGLEGRWLLLDVGEMVLDGILLLLDA